MPVPVQGETYFTYSNMNFPIVASIVELATGERFDIWMRANVLDPMRVDGCFNWPTCSDAAIARAVQLSAPDGTPIRDDLHGRRPDCPVYVEEPVPCEVLEGADGTNERGSSGATVGGGDADLSEGEAASEGAP